jgi:hypothetical protein
MNARTHIVLVPGFGGFDALGQIEYYAGVTPVFDEWVQAAAPGSAASRATLRYFDNLPTAAVTTRAQALRAYLEKRLARREFQPGDRIALVGHSTGGLDIRQLLRDLQPERTAGPRFIDGDANAAVSVHAEALLSNIQRLGFLSVPQRGTNIAQCVEAYERDVLGSIRLLAAAVAAAHARPLAPFERWLGLFNPRDVPEVLLAARDALLETLEPGGRRDGYAAALARQAYEELSSYLGNASSDFFAIPDLAPLGPSSTPARYDETAREEEKAAWAARGVRTRSFATIGRPPFDRPPKVSAAGAVRDRAGLLAELAHVDREHRTDATYRFSYAACASGPFRADPSSDSVRDGGGIRKIEPWENDGIVNTASMLWPDGPETTLVHADHADIIGHYRLSPAVSPEQLLSGRVNHTYDIFKSSSGFDERVFKAVWKDLFDFCVS